MIEMESQDLNIDALAKKVSNAFDRLHIEGIQHNLTTEEIEALYAAAYQLFQQGDLEKSTIIFNFLCIYESQEPRFWTALAIAFQKQRKWSAAIDAYSIAALLDATNIRLYFHVTECLMENREWDRARQSLDAFFHICETVYGENRSNVSRFIDKAEVWKDVIAAKLAQQGKSSRPST